MDRDPRFHTTKWSMIAAASATRSDPDTRGALAALCEAYWYPVYAFIRRSGHSNDDVLDLTQGFFANLLEKDLLKVVDRARGRFRSFLLATVKQFLLDDRKRVATLKRGGHIEFVTLDGALREDRERAHVDTTGSPETDFEKHWALTIFNRASARLESEFSEAGKRDEFLLLQPHLSGDRGAKSYAEIASALQATESAIKSAALRLRRRFGTLLREEVAQTIERDADIDAELRHLLSVI